MRVGEFEFTEPLPELHEPHAIAILRPWVDAGNVGTLALDRLEKMLGTQELGRLVTPGDFFDFTRYRPRTHQVEGRRVVDVPNTVISYAKGNGETPDLLLCRVLEPHASAERYLSSLMEVMKLFNAKRYCRIGAMYDAVPHTRPLRLSGSLNGQPLTLKGAVAATNPRRGYRGPTTIFGLFNEQLEREGIEPMTLMARLPQYLQMEDDYSGVARMLEALAELYHLPEDFPEAEWGRRQYRRVDEQLEGSGPGADLVEKLETLYDADAPEAPTVEPDSPLSPEVERFLEDLDIKLEDPQE